MPVRFMPRGIAIAVSCGAVVVCVTAIGLWLAAAPWGDASDEADTPDGGEVTIMGSDGEWQEVLDIAGASPAQREALADGEVSWQEYESSTFAAIDCMRQGGLQIRGEPEVDPSGKVVRGWGVVVASDADVAEANDAVAAECIEENARFVWDAWSIQIRPTDEDLVAARDALRTCLSGAGVPDAALDEGPLLNVLRDGHVSISTFASCSQSVSKEFGIPDFGG